MSYIFVLFIEPAVRQSHHIQNPEVIALRAHFVSVSAQFWAEGTVSNEIRRICMMDRFLNVVNEGQVRRQYSRYKIECHIRLNIGVELRDCSLSMCSFENKFINKHIESILAMTFRPFDASSSFSQLLPVELHDFFFRVRETVLSKINNSTGKFYLKEDCGRIISFIEFIKHDLIPIYSKVWDLFADITYNPTTGALLGEDPTQLLSDIEAEIKQIRSQFLTHDKFEILKKFKQNTYINEAICSVRNVTVLYPPERFNQPIGFYPPYVRHVLSLQYPNNTDELVRVIFDAFEQSVWEFYVENITLYKLYLFPSVTNKSDPSAELSHEISTQLSEILYYVGGCAYHAMISLETVKDWNIALNGQVYSVLSSGLLLTKDAAIQSELPCHRVFTKEKVNLCYINRNLFDLLIQLDNKVLNPILSDEGLLAAYGNELFGVIVDNLEDNFKSKFVELIEDSLGMNKNDNIHKDSTVTVQQIVQQMYNKFVDYYCNVMVKEFCKRVMNDLKLKECLERNVKFRLGVLTKCIK